VSDAWFRWRYYHPSEAEDPASAFAAGRKLGNREALQDSAYIQVVPLLEALLNELIEDRIDRAVEASDLRATTPPEAVAVGRGNGGQEPAAGRSVRRAAGSVADPRLDPEDVN